MKKKLFKQKRRLFISISVSMLVLSIIVYAVFAVTTYYSELDLLTSNAQSSFHQATVNMQSYSNGNWGNYLLNRKYDKEFKDISAYFDADEQIKITDTDTGAILCRTGNAVSVEFQGDIEYIGGETAEMPGFYPVDEYDLAGFSVGVVDKDKVLDNSAVTEGDVVIALPSSGVHSNGFSLVRRVFGVGESDKIFESFNGSTIGETLLTPTKIYVKPMLALFNEITVKAVSHITGGGFYENIPRSIPKGFGAKIEKAAVRVLPVFDLIRETGGIPERDMFNTFNMGVGMSVTVSKNDADKALEILKANGEDAYIIGEIIRSEDGVVIC